MPPLNVKLRLLGRCGGSAAFLFPYRSGHLGRPTAGAHHVVGPALAAAGEVIAKGDQALVQLTGEHWNAARAGVMAEPVAGHADLAAACLAQHVLRQVRPVLGRVRRR